MPTIAEIRQQYPQYNDMSDQGLASALHAKFYSDMPLADFNAKIGLQPQNGDLTADNAARAVATGTPILGGLLNKMDAATNATLAPLVDPMLPDGYQKLSGNTWGGRYQQALDIQEGKDTAFQSEHPYANAGLNVAGAIATTAPLMMAAPGAFGIGNGSLIGRTAASAASGAVLGGADSAVRSDGDLKQTEIGAGMGGVLGAAGPAIGKAIGSGVRYFTNPNDAISGMSGGAQKYVTNELSDPVKVAAQQSALAQLGPEATLADVSPEWLGVARGAATRPGTRDAIVNALTERQGLANQRLGTDLDASMGAPVIPSQIEQGLAANRNLVGQQYGPIVDDARAVNTQPLADMLDSATVNLRGPEQQAVQRVRTYLNVPGTDVLDPNPQALLSTRQAIDGLLTNEQNPQVIRQLTMARQQVDIALAEAAPGIKGADAQYSELARQSTALGQGRAILSNEASALRPQELQDMLHQGAQPQGIQVGPSAVPLRMQQGVRGEIDRLIGTNANDTTAMRRLVRGEGDWNRDKLGMLFGQDNADRALNAIDRESVFADTANRVTRGSDTALASRFGDFLDNAAKPREIPADLTMLGAALHTGKKITSAFLRQNAGEKAAKFANELGQLSVAQGSSRDQLVQALLTRAKNGPSGLTPQMQAIINATIESAGHKALRP